MKLFYKDENGNLRVKEKDFDGNILDRNPNPTEYFNEVRIYNESANSEGVKLREVIDKVDINKYEQLRKKLLEGTATAKEEQDFYTLLKKEHEGRIPHYIVNGNEPVKIELGEENGKSINRGDIISTDEGNIVLLDLTKTEDPSIKIYKDRNSGKTIIKVIGNKTKEFLSINSGSTIQVSPGGKVIIEDHLKNEKDYPDKGGYKFFYDNGKIHKNKIPQKYRYNIKKPQEEHPEG
jgi:hypothetical protein